MTQIVNNPKPLRLLIADDYAGVRRELRTLLSLNGGIEVVGEAADGESAVRLAAALTPDVVIMDLDMPVMDGLTAAGLVKQQSPACRVIALTVHGGDAERQTALRAGCDVFLVKGAPLEDLVGAIFHSSPIKKI